MSEVIQGLADAKAALEELKQDLAKKVIRGALRDAARPIVNQAKSNAPKQTGLLRKSIRVFSSKLRRISKGEIGVYIKPKVSKKAKKEKGKDPYYYRWIEAGYHAVGRRKVSGKGLERKKKLFARAVRWIPGKLFMGKAIDSKNQQVVDVFSQAIKKRIDLANRRK